MRPILSLDYQLESLYLWGLSASYLILWLEIYRGFLSFYSFWTILWQHCFVALIYVWVVANVFTSILIMRFISPFQALCVCVWGGRAVGGCRLYPGLRARCAHASPSALLYPNGKLQRHFTCGFNFRHNEGVKGCFKDTMKAYFCYVHTLLETLSRLLKITITILKLQMCSYNGCSLI